MSESSNLKYLVTPLAAIGLPAGQAVISGFSVGLIAGSISIYFGNPRALALAALAGSLAFGLGWLAGLAWWRSRVAGKVQEAAPAQTYQAQTRVEIIASDPSGAFMQGCWADLPIDLPKLAKVARRVEAGASFSHADLAGPHKPLSRAEFEALRSEFVLRGLAYWRNPEAHAQGCELSRAGGAVLRRLAEQTDDNPLPQQARILPRILSSPRGLHTHAGARASILEIGG